MALINMQFFSKALNTNVTVNVILPEIPKKNEGVGSPDGEYKTLYLLHGLSGDCNEWMRYSSIERYAKDYGIAVVMPSVGRSWYTDTAYDANYFTFVANELPDVCRSYFKGITDKKENTFIAGLSMGGYGALKIALNFPERYMGCISLSGSLDITRKGRPCNLNEWKANFDFNLTDPLSLENSKNDLFALTKKFFNNSSSRFKIFLWCGTEDPLVKINREYHTLLNEHGIEHVYKESEGDHSWKWWDMHIQDGLKFLFK